MPNRGTSRKKRSIQRKICNPYFHNPIKRGCHFLSILFKLYSHKNNLILKVELDVCIDLGIWSSTSKSMSNVKPELILSTQMTLMITIIDKSQTQAFNSSTRVQKLQFFQATQEWKTQPLVSTNDQSVIKGQDLDLLLMTKVFNRPTQLKLAGIFMV